VFERNGYKTYLTEGKFQQLYNECKNLALPQVSKCAEPVSGRLLINFNNKLSRYQEELPKDIIIQWNELFEKLINNC
jgi:hypothetical protein